MLVFLYVFLSILMLRIFPCFFPSHVEDIIQGLDVGLSLPLSC